MPTFTRVVHEPKLNRLAARSDQLAVEEPLEIRLKLPNGNVSTIGITMRTPGNDFELVAGYLLAEAAIESSESIATIAYCTDRELDAQQRFNVVTAELLTFPGKLSLERLVVTSASCGVCGSASIEAVHVAGHPQLMDGPLLSFSQLGSLPESLRLAQRGFSVTGGLHGIGLFNGDAELLCCREDVGRHNAVDKVIGWALLQDRLPLSDHILMVSGRISFEIVQKALRAGIGFVAAVSAATSLAAELANDVGMTLVGFVRGSRCTIYSGRDRLGYDDASCRSTTDR